MNRWNSLIEYLLLPLKILLLGLSLQMLGSFILEGNATTLLNITWEPMLTLANLLVLLGQQISDLFIILVMFSLLATRYEDRSIIMNGLLGYFVFYLVQMFFVSSTLPAAVYRSVFGLSLNLSNLGTLLGEGTKLPVQGGLIVALIVTGITRSTYRLTRSEGSFGLFGLTDLGIRSVIYNVLLCALAGALFAVVAPYLVAFLYWAVDVIAQDISNPIDLLLFGSLHRILAMIGVEQILTTEFWFSSRGGSWMDAYGEVYKGDVTIWLAQQAQNIRSAGIGRFISGFYLLNVFAMPGYLFALWRTYTRTVDRNRMIFLFILLLCISLIVGNPLPMEAFMLITTPFLYLFHLLLSGVFFALAQGMNLALGATTLFNGTVLGPGNLFDLIYYSHLIDYATTAQKLVALGAIFMVIYYAITTFYYRKIALSPLALSDAETKIDAFIKALGGIENLRWIGSDPLRVMVALEDRSKLDIAALHYQGVSRVVEMKRNYRLSYGAGSYMLASRIQAQLKAHALREV